LEAAKMATPYAKLLVAQSIGAFAVLGWHADATAQSDYPNRPVRVVNPYAPGGAVDLVGRAVATGLGQIWGQQVIVDNRPGAGTMIGTEIVARADPDGYTMLCTTAAIAIMPSMYRNMRFDTVRDLYPIVHIVSTPSMLAVHPSVSAKSVKELIALAKAQPGKITVGASGFGTSNHLTAELFQTTAQVKLVVVPYKGGGPAISDFIGGQVDMFFNTPAALLPLAKNGRARVLAILELQRTEYAPDIPALAETFPGFEAATWYGVYGPRALPQALAQRWNEAVNQYLKTAQAQTHFRTHHMRIAGGTIAGFADYHKSETARWGKVIAAAGIKPQ
jgi:tripartite-type tricarboxylate transporter receptor subunit TctC